MLRFTYSSTGALRLKRDLTEYVEALGAAVGSHPVVRADFEELKGKVS